MFGQGWMLSILHTVLLIVCPVLSVIRPQCHHCIFQMPGSRIQIFDEHTSHTLLNTISKSLDKESKDFQACELAPSFLQKPLSSQHDFGFEAWEEEIEGWTRCGINTFNRLLLWFFPQYPSTSPNPQISTTPSLCCFAGSWMGCGEKPGDPTALGGDEDRSVADGDKGWHRISITDTMITTCNSPCATAISVNYSAAAGVISWPRLATHCRRYLHYAH